MKPKLLKQLKFVHNLFLEQTPVILAKCEKKIQLVKERILPRYTTNLIGHPITERRGKPRVPSRTQTETSVHTRKKIIARTCKLNKQNQALISISSVYYSLYNPSLILDRFSQSY